MYRHAIHAVESDCDFVQEEPEFMDLLVATDVVGGRVGRTKRCVADVRLLFPPPIGGAGKPISTPALFLTLVLGIGVAVFLATL